MMGPEGCAILYINRELQEQVEPVEFGWTNVAGYADYGSRDMALRPDAGRYEPGTLNTIGCFGLRASLEFILEVGVGEIAPVVQNLGDRIAAGVAGQRLRGLGKSDAGNRSRHRELPKARIRGHGNWYAGCGPPELLLLLAPAGSGPPPTFTSAPPISTGCWKSCRDTSACRAPAASRLARAGSAPSPQPGVLDRASQAAARQPPDHRAGHARFRMGRSLLHRRELHLAGGDPVHAGRQPHLLGSDRVQRQLRFALQRAAARTAASTTSAIGPPWRPPAWSWTGTNSISPSLPRSRSSCGATMGCAPGPPRIARYDWGRSSAGVTFTWTGATASSDSNPAGTIDVGAGYGFQLKGSGPLSHLSPHANWLYEKSTGSIRQISLFEGVEYQITESPSPSIFRASTSTSGAARSIIRSSPD